MLNLLGWTLSILLPFIFSPKVAVSMEPFLEVGHLSNLGALTPIEDERICSMYVDCIVQFYECTFVNSGYSLTFHCI